MAMDRARTVLVTLVTGELLAGRRTQELPWSTPLIQSSWKVAWAATVAMRVAAAVSFLNISSNATMAVVSKIPEREGEARYQC